MGQRNTHSLYGSTDKSSCVPDASTKAGPAYDIDGSLVLRESFQVSCSRALDGVPGQYLADALTVWDCLAKRRMERAPLLLRFEDFDVVFSADSEGRLAFWQGSVDTSGSMKVAVGGSSEAPDNDRVCPAWVPASTLSKIVGSQATGIIETDDTSALVCFGEDNLHLKSRRDAILYRLASNIRDKH